jgi:hypothetical protein
MNLKCKRSVSGTAAVEGPLLYLFFFDGSGEYGTVSEYGTVLPAPTF